MRKQCFQKETRDKVSDPVTRAHRGPCLCGWPQSDHRAKLAAPEAETQEWRRILRDTGSLQWMPWGQRLTHVDWLGPEFPPGMVMAERTPLLQVTACARARAVVSESECRLQ